MIPKKIHYCWFGGNDLPDIAKKCIASWKEYCPDYEIIQWDESNCDLNCMLYVKEAYESKNWAFVSDIMRLLIIYSHGGIYLDTDVEALKNFDELLGYDSFWGFESKKYVNTGLGFGAVAKNKVLKQLIESYEGVHFKLENNMYNKIPCPHTNTKVFENMGFTINGKTQKVGNDILFAKEYFCPINYKTLECKIVDKTFSIHHYNASWLNEEEKFYQNIYATLMQKYGYHIGRLIYFFKYVGIQKGIKILFNKLKM